MNKNYFIFRKYYSILCDIFYRLLENAYNKQLAQDKFAFINCYFPMVNKFSQKKTIPNEVLLNLLKKISIFESQTGFYDKINNNENIEIKSGEVVNNFSQPKLLYELKYEQKTREIKLFLKQKNMEINCKILEPKQLLNNLLMTMKYFIEDLNLSKINDELISNYIINILYF